MNFYRTTGIIYKTKNFRDRDKLVWVLTADNGKVSCIAKGVKKINSKRSGHIDIFNLNKLSFHKGKNLDILTEAISINTFEELKKQYTYEIFYLAELIDKITMDDEEASRVFYLVKEILEKSNKENFQKLLILFELKLLKIIGFEPNFFTYLDTGENLTLDKKIYISTETPGLLTEGDRNAEISPNAVKCQRFCLNQSVDATIALKIEPSIQEDLSRINKLWMQNMLEMKIKSLEFLNL